MTLLAGVAMAETLIPIVPSRITIKWPNDVLAGGKKVAGILIEIATEIDNIDYMIVGVGLNVNTPAGRFPADLRKRATSLAVEIGHPVARAEILGAFLERFERYYDLTGREGFAPVIRRWRELSDMVGRRVPGALVRRGPGRHHRGDRRRRRTSADQSGRRRRARDFGGCGIYLTG